MDGNPSNETHPWEGSIAAVLVAEELGAKCATEEKEITNGEADERRR